MKSFTMLVCLPKSPTQVVRVEDAGDHTTLSILQQTVGGNIETCARRTSGDFTLDAYCHEDEPESSPPNRMMPNGQPVRGRVVVTAANSNGETVSLEGVHLANAIAWAESWPVNVSSPEQEAAASVSGHECGNACVARDIINAELGSLLDEQLKALKASMYTHNAGETLRRIDMLGNMLVTLRDAVAFADGLIKQTSKPRDKRTEN